MKVSIKFLFCFLGVIICNLFSVSAQTGPGGIEDTTGTSNLYLWLDATRIEGISNLNTVSTWEDLSGYNHDASASNAATKPHLRTNIVNGHQVLSFDGNSNHLDGSLGGTFGSPSTVIVVPYYDDPNQLPGENGYVISIGTGGAARAHYSIARRNSGGSDGNKYYAWINDGTPKLGDTIVGETWNIITQVSATSSPFHSMYLNGAASSTLTEYSGSGLISTDGVYRVGQWYNGGTNRLDGRLAEVIVYNRVLNTLELNIVQSYLSAKYDIAISNDFYTGDLMANGDNDKDVVGLGVVGTDSSKEVHSAGLRLEISADFDNEDYVMFGHNVSENSINIVDIGDIDDTLEARWDRAWWLDITNTGNTVDCDFIFSQIDAEVGFGGLNGDSSNHYKLIHRAATSGNWTVIASASGVTLNEIYFNNVDLSADGYYTVASIDTTNSPIGNSPMSSAYNGPGGVGGTDGNTHLKLWFNVGDKEGQDGDEVLSIADESGNGNDVTQTTFLNIPNLEADAVNGRSAVTFNGANGYLSGTMGFNFNPPFTVFTVAYFANANQANDDNDYVYSAGEGLSRGDQMSLSRRKANDEDDLANINKYYSWDGDTARFGDAITGQTWYVFTQEFRSTGASVLHNASFNGTDANATDNEVEVNASSNLLSIGRWNGNDHWLDGQFSELIIYDSNLNAAEINIVQSYLSGKYNIAVNNDKYNGDDLIRGDNDLNIAGVGTETDGSNVSASSMGIIVEQVSGFTNGDYALFGHAVANNSVNSTDAADNLGTNEARWDRAWYFDTTNTGADLVVNISFDFSDVQADAFPGFESSNNYSLLYRSGTSGTWTNQTLSPTLNGDQVVFSNVTLADGFYTLGSSATSNSPLPVTIGDFTVTRLVNSALINWVTESEINNNYFLLERSTNGKDYELIERIRGGGNSFDTKYYSVQDIEINSHSTYYYRLRQFDYDGKTETFGPIALNGSSTPSKMKIFPNPATEVVYLEGLQVGARVRLFKTKGELILEKIKQNEGRMKISTQSIEKGVYFLEVTSEQETQIVMLLIQ